MAGILDFLQTPDAQMGIGLLAAGGPSTVPMSVGQRVQAAMQGLSADKQNALKLKLLQSQVDENASQNALRQATLAQQQKRDAFFMGGEQPASAPGMPASTAIPGSSPVAPGMPTSAPVGGMPGAPAGGDKFSQLASQYGVPRDALVIDYLQNGGKGIAEMIAKRGTPDMQVSNGYAYDKNKLGAGYLPQLNVSQDGKATQVQIGPDGMPEVSAPRGAIGTFGAYQGQAANFKPIKVFNPQTGREEYTSEGAVVQPRATPAPMAGAGGNVSSPGYSGGDRNAANAESIRMIQSELQKPGNNPSDVAGMQREIQRLQQQSGQPSGNFAAGPSMQEKTNAQFNEKMAGDQATMLTDSAKAAKSASDELAGIQEAKKSVDAGVFAGSGANQKLAIAKFVNANIPGITIDPDKVGNTDYLKSTLGRGLLEQAKTLGSNPSNADAARINDIVGDIGKDPAAMKKILDWRESMAVRAIQSHNSKVDQAEGNGFKPQFDLRVKLPEQRGADAQPKKSFSDFGYKSQSEAIKDAQNAMLKNPKAKAEILRRLNGMGITPEGNW